MPWKPFFDPGAREWWFWWFKEKMSSIKAEEVCLWGLLFFLSLLNLELFFSLDLFSLSDPSSGLLLFKFFFLCHLNFFDSVVFHMPSALGSWILAFVVFFMWMDGFFVLKMPALFVGFAVCEYFHVVGFLQGLMLLWMWIWEFFCGSGFPGHVVPEWELLLQGLKSKAKFFCVFACELREIFSPGVSDYMLFISLDSQWIGLHQVLDLCAKVIKY